MFNTFWSLCGAACPSTSINKLHSEYRSTYKWHEYAPNNSRDIIVRKPPKPRGNVGAHDSGEGSNRARINQPPQTTTEKAFLNGSIGGLPPAGVSSSSRAAVTTVPPKSIQDPPTSVAAVVLPSKHQPPPKEHQHLHQHQQQEEQQPQTPPLDAEQGGMDPDDRFQKRSYKSEYRKKFRPFSQYQYVDGKFHKAKPEEAETAGNAWYKEVLELRRQAGQYRARQDLGDVWKTMQCRGWGVETASERMTEIYSKQVELWEQVSRRSSLQALSLASAAPASRPISKAEKEIENSRRSSPIKHVRERPGTAPSKQKLASVHKAGADKVDAKVKDASAATAQRHHYDRTTGTGGRSVSVGPENRSPKRTPRPPATATPHAPTTVTKPERRPRPTSLTTSSRRKGVDSTTPHHEAKKPTKKLHDVSASPKRSDLKSREDKRRLSEEESKKDKDKEKEKDQREILRKNSADVLKDSSSGRKSTPEPRFDPEKFEPVVKTPPEPTRVKSPDQVMVKSPDPVNWTVPLDTGKTFTVMHNIPEGESSRGTPSTEHRPPLESRSRQTPEPTRVYQGSLAGTPITTAGSAGSTPLATTAAASSTAPSSESKTASKTVTAGTSPLAGTTGVPPPSSSLKSIDKTSNISEPTVKFSPDTKFSDNDEVKKPLSDSFGDMNKSMIIPQKDRPLSPEVAPLTRHGDAFASQLAAKPSTVEKQMPISSSSSAPSPPLGPPTGAADPMTMSYFGSINGMNGKSSGTPSPTKPEMPITETKKEDLKTNVTPQTIQGSNLRRLDDPFSAPTEAPLASATPKAHYKVLDAPIETSSPKSGSYRVLEAPVPPVDKKDHPESSLPQPDCPSKSAHFRVLEAPTTDPPRPAGSPYRILEAPDAPFSQQAQPVGSSGPESKPPSLVSPSSGRTVTEALDKARNRFDSFWGTGKDKDPPSKV